MSNFSTPRQITNGIIELSKRFNEIVFVYDLDGSLQSKTPPPQRISHLFKKLAPNAFMPLSIPGSIQRLNAKDNVRTSIAITGRDLGFAWDNYGLAGSGEFHCSMSDFNQEGYSITNNVPRPDFTKIDQQLAPILDQYNNLNPQSNNPRSPFIEKLDFTYAIKWIPDDETALYNTAYQLMQNNIPAEMELSASHNPKIQTHKIELQYHKPPPKDKSLKDVLQQMGIGDRNDILYIGIGDTPGGPQEPRTDSPKANYITNERGGAYIYTGNKFPAKETKGNNKFVSASPTVNARILEILTREL